MLRTVARGFSRDEWAYLAKFLDAHNLDKTIRESFGAPTHHPIGVPLRIYRARGPIAVWLPSNVSLLGPLTLVLLSLTGQRLLLKLGSRNDDLAAAFLDFARNTLGPGVLRSYLEQNVSAESFSRGDAREREMTSVARVRIVFGSDQAALAIHSLPHPVDSIGISFSDRQSEAWLDTRSADDETLKTLLRIFAVYGQAGCTSPKRAVLIGASESERKAVFERLVGLSSSVFNPKPAMNIASDTLMSDQWARALGWRTERTPGNGALLATGDGNLEDFDGIMALKLEARSLEDAFRALPANIQTIGYALANPPDSRWMELLATSSVARFVPIARMHHFSGTWDGEPFWARCFEVMELGS